MLAAVVVVSIFSGLFAVGAAVMLDLPLWVSIMAYPMGGCLGLILAATLAGLGSQRSGALIPATASALARRP